MKLTVKVFVPMLTLLVCTLSRPCCSDPSLALWYLQVSAFERRSTWTLYSLVSDLDTLVQFLSLIFCKLYWLAYLRKIPQPQVRHVLPYSNGVYSSNTPIAWSSAILTMSLVIPAIIQKKQEALTLYHATQVLNFVTFSSLASLAVVSTITQNHSFSDFNKRNFNI